MVLLIQSVPYASSLIVSLASAFPLPARLLGTTIARMSSPGTAGGRLRASLRRRPGRLSPCARQASAIISMLAAVAAFSGMDALLKFFSSTYPPMEVAVLRGAASLPFMLLPVLLIGR